MRRRVENAAAQPPFTPIGGTSLSNPVAEESSVEVEKAGPADQQAFAALVVGLRGIGVLLFVALDIMPKAAKSTVAPMPADGPSGSTSCGKERPDWDVAHMGMGGPA